MQLPVFDVKEVVSHAPPWPALHSVRQDCPSLPTLAGYGQLDPRKGLSQAIGLISAAGSY